MAAQVGADDTVAAAEGFGPRIPDTVVGAQGMQQQQGLGARRAFELDVERGVA
ncbi:hypothetical protein ACFQU7_27625 [Pseudoroseomonas wenyumeiae]